MYQKQGYHIVDASPWPRYRSSSLGRVMTGVFIFLHSYENAKIVRVLGMIRGLGTIYTWRRDVVRESMYEGQHTRRVQIGIRYGFRRFIFSELILFIGVFGTYRWSSRSPSIELGGIWPPKGIIGINPWGIPRRNTVILLSSGVSLTWAHHSVRSGEREGGRKGRRVTVRRGRRFIRIQVKEYVDIEYTIADSVYGSIFYIGTGLHGRHVVRGVRILRIGRNRRYKHERMKENHLGREVSIWYWHFVDVVWLRLFIIIYVWGN